MYAEHAKPIPRRFLTPRRAPSGATAPFEASPSTDGAGEAGARNRQPRHLERHPEASTTLSMHSVSPMVVTVKWLAVFVNGSVTIRRRISAGSRPSCSAALSILD